MLIRIRRHPDLNWGKRICSPPPYHSAMPPTRYKIFLFCLEWITEHLFEFSLLQCTCILNLFSLIAFTLLTKTNQNLSPCFLLDPYKKVKIDDKHEKLEPLTIHLTPILWTIFRFLFQILFTKWYNKIQMITKIITNQYYDLSIKNFYLFFLYLNYNNNFEYM